MDIIADFRSFDSWTLVWSVAIGAVLFLVTLALALRSGRSNKNRSKPTVLLVGPSGAGKTSLFLNWTSNASGKETITSVAPNVSESVAVFDGYRLVDSPGNEKLQQFALDSLRHDNVKSVIFMVDASSGPENVAAAARPLLAVLELTEPKLIPVLVAANKFDLFSTLSLRKVTSILESELSDLRDTQSRTVPSSEDDEKWGDSERVYLGLDGKPFKFSDLESEVVVVDGSVKTGRLAKWESWLQGAMGL